MEIRVDSWSELDECLFGSWIQQDQHVRPTVAYRGLGDSRYNLETSLKRLGGKYDQLETHIIRNFRKYAHTVEFTKDSTWNWLALAQHHGLPTRLIDWTFSPYIALHFATANSSKFTCDSVVWCVNYTLAHELLPDTLKSRLNQEGAGVFTTDLIEIECQNLEQFDGLCSEVFVLFFEPPSLDERIINQSSLFSIMSSPTTRLDDWLEQRSDLYRKIVIPAHLKPDIRERLDRANITERVLFPGLDGLCKWLRRYYSPKSDSCGCDE